MGGGHPKQGLTLLHLREQPDRLQDRKLRSQERDGLSEGPHLGGIRARQESGRATQHYFFFHVEVSILSKPVAVALHWPDKTI